MNKSFIRPTARTIICVQLQINLSTAGFSLTHKLIVGPELPGASNRESNSRSHLTTLYSSHWPLLNNVFPHWSSQINSSCVHLQLDLTERWDLPLAIRGIIKNRGLKLNPLFSVVTWVRFLRGLLYHWWSGLCSNYVSNTQMFFYVATETLLIASLMQPRYGQEYSSV